VPSSKRPRQGPRDRCPGDPRATDPRPQDPHPQDPHPQDPHREDPRRRLGRFGEELAVAHLRRLGFALLARNARTRHGEIDLIAFDGAVLIFIEVKTRRLSAHSRRHNPFEQPLAGLRPRQRARLRRLAAAWLCDETHVRPRAHTIRFDAIGVTVDAKNNLVCLDHVEGAW
jgi:putative endonuclease